MGLCGGLAFWAGANKGRDKGIVPSIIRGRKKVGGERASGVLSIAPGGQAALQQDPDHRHRPVGWVEMGWNGWIGWEDFDTGCFEGGTEQWEMRCGVLCVKMVSESGSRLCLLIDGVERSSEGESEQW